MRRGNTGLVMPALALIIGASWGLPAAARPLDAETCDQLKLQRDTLERAGARQTIKLPPPSSALATLDERAEQIRALIDVDGQLRFRCGIDLPITTLRPELLEEVPDSIEGEGAAKVAKGPSPRAKKAVAKAKSEAAASGAGGDGTPKRKGASKIATEGASANDIAPDAEAGAPTTGKAGSKPRVKGDAARAKDAAGQADEATAHPPKP